MAQARLKGSGIISFDDSDFVTAPIVNYIEKDKTAADSEGEPIKGGLEFTGTATNAQVVSGKTFYNSSGGLHTIRTGTLTFQSASATKASDVESGGIFYNNSPNVYTATTGTLSMSGTATQADVLSGYTFHKDGLHTTSAGTAKLLTDSSKDTTAAMVASTKIFYGGSTSSKSGTLKFDGNAKTSEVIKGKTYYDTDLHSIRTGTLDWSTAGTATTVQVESGKTFYQSKTAAQFATPSANILTGTLNFNSASATKASDIISGKSAQLNNLHAVTNGTLAFSGTAVASDVIKYKTFHNKDVRKTVTGTLVISGDATASQVVSGKKFYTSNAASPTVGTLSWATAAASGTAVAANVLSGKTFYNNSLTTKVTGTMKDNGAVSTTLNSGGSYTIPVGYHNGGGKVSENSPYAQTNITTSPATAAKIWKDKTAYVNGSVVTGTGTVANTTGVSGSNAKDHYAAGDNKVTITWTFPTYSFFTGVCILRKGGSTAPSSTSPSTDSNKVYMGAGTKSSNGVHYWIDYVARSGSGTSYVSYSIYPYVVVNGTTYFYGSPTPRTITSIRLYGTCSCDNKDCDGSCSCDGECCQACSF